MQWYYDGRASDTQEILVGEQPITVRGSAAGDSSDSAPSNLADLEVIVLSVNGSTSPTVNVGETVTIAARVKNTGDGDADESTVHFYSFFREIGKGSVERLGPGASQEWTLRHTVRKNDGRGSSRYLDWDLRVVADSGSDISEVDELNNSRVISGFIITPPCNEDCSGPILNDPPGCTRPRV